MEEVSEVLKDTKLASLLVLVLLCTATGLPAASVSAQEPYYVIGYTACEDVQETEPWDPINTTEVFSTLDERVVLWVRFGNVVSELYLRYELIKPDGTLFGTGEDFVEHPSKYGYDYYETYTHSMTMWLEPIEGLGDPRDYPGEWKVDLYVNDEYVLTFNFVLLKFGITDYKMCESMQESSPWDPINEKNVFGKEDQYATAWLELSNVTKGLNLEFRWIDPEGALVFTNDVHVPDPRTQGAEYYSTFRLGQQFTLTETDYYKDPKEKPGLWRVEIYIEGKKELEMTFTVEKPPGCLIATAAYGSELAPEVQALREFRDGIVMNTKAGNYFMRVFNAFYYSFSPKVAELEAQHEILRSFVRIAIKPLLIVLSVGSRIYGLLSLNPELGIIVSGIVISSMIGAIYAAPALTLMDRILKADRRIYRKASLAFSLLLVSGLVLLGTGEIFYKPSLLMSGSTSLVLTTILLSAIFTFNLILGLIDLVKKHVSLARVPKRRTLAKGV